MLWDADVQDLRESLVLYVKRKFYTRRNILDMTDEIVNQAFCDVMKSPRFEKEQLNFGYMSLACIRTAYKFYHRNDRDSVVLANIELTTPLIDEHDFVDDIVKAEDTAFVLRSLQTLKQMEQIIVNERYYGCYTFREISERHGINLSTVLSHHRRALGKLKPILARYFSFE